MESPAPDLTKVTEVKRFLKSVLTHGYWTFKPLQAPLTEGKLIFLAKAFSLSRDKNNYFCWLQMYPFSSLFLGSCFKMGSPTQFI
jgi:hypothetical protein